MTGPFGPVLGPGGGVGTLVIDATAGCVYVDALLPAGERYFMQWFEGTTATPQGLTTFLGEIIPNGGPIQFYGFSAPIASELTGLDIRKTTPPEFLHCLDQATHVMGRGPVRSGCFTCTEPRKWPLAVSPAYNDLTCEPPLC